MKSKEVVTLQIVMNSEARDALHKNGRLAGDRDRISEKDWTGPYQWIADQMANLIGHSADGNDWPMWAWSKNDDLDPENYDEDDLWLVTFEADPSKVVLSDFGAWHYVLNGWYLPDETSPDQGEAESEAFDQELEAAGINWADRPYPAPFWDKVQNSWERIFDVEASTGAVQATFWDLKLDQVISEKPIVRNQSNRVSR